MLLIAGQLKLGARVCMIAHMCTEPLLLPATRKACLQ